MTQVITEQQARQITGGRTPLVPIEYEAACKALEACETLDEAKYWSDKSDALAAWAKIYHDDVVTLKAKRLKLKAYRRMGELAFELRPAKGKKGHLGGGAPGPRSLLMEMGLNKAESDAARTLAKMRSARFFEETDRPHPRSPIYAAQRGAAGASEAWAEIAKSGVGLMSFQSWCGRHDARALCSVLSNDEAQKCRSAVLKIQEWLDAFEQYLPKAAK